MSSGHKGKRVVSSSTSSSDSDASVKHVERKKTTKTERRSSQSQKDLDKANAALAEAQAKVDTAAAEAKAAKKAAKRAIRQQAAQLLGNQRAREGEDMEVDPPVSKPKKGGGSKSTKTSVSDSKTPVKASTSGTAKSSPVDKRTPSATPPSSRIPKVKPKAERSKSSSETPPNAPEPLETNAAAIEGNGGMPIPSPEVATESWEALVKKASERRRNHTDTRVTRTLKSYSDGNCIRLPDLTGPGGSDDEEWLQDEGHPIDWYVGKVMEVVGASVESSIAEEERLRIGFAWRIFNPGQECCFDGCSPPGAPERTYSSDGRYARHLVEHHRAVRPRFGCNTRQGNVPCTQVRGEKSAKPFTTLRRGLLVRHLREGAPQPHRYGTVEAVRIVNALVQSEEGGEVDGRVVHKFWMVMENRNDGNPRRLYIRKPDMWAAFHGANPTYRHKRSGSRTRSRGGSTAGRGGRGGASKRTCSVDSSTPRVQPKKPKAGEEVAPSGGREARNRDPKATTSTVPDGRTYSNVVSGSMAAPARPTPSAAAGSAGSAGMGGTLVCIDDQEPRFGQGHTAGLPRMNWYERCRGLMEMTGSPALDDFGRGFRDEANAFMFGLFERTSRCLRQDVLPQMQAEQEQKAGDAAASRLQSMEDRLGDLQVNHDYEVEQLEVQLATFKSIDQEFHRVFGISLARWSSLEDRSTRMLAPRRIQPTTEMARFVTSGKTSSGRIPTSDELRLRDLSNLGTSPSAALCTGLSRVVVSRSPSTVSPLREAMHAAGLAVETVRTPGRDLGPSCYDPAATSEQRVPTPQRVGVLSPELSGITRLGVQATTTATEVQPCEPSSIQAMEIEAVGSVLPSTLFADDQEEGDRDSTKSGGRVLSDDGTSGHGSEGEGDANEDDVLDDDGLETKRDWSDIMEGDRLLDDPDYDPLAEGEDVVVVDDDDTPTGGPSTGADVEEVHVGGQLDGEEEDL